MSEKRLYCKLAAPTKADLEDRKASFRLLSSPSASLSLFLPEPAVHSNFAHSREEKGELEEEEGARLEGEIEFHCE